MNLVLIGYRGTGKSTVAGLLAKTLAMEVVSLDQEIVRHAGCAIPEIVAEHGWPHFRDIESEITKRFSERDNIIIDAGGGVILRAENVKNLRRNGTLFWLRASVPAIVARIEGGTQRPALTAGKSFTEEVEDVLRERTPLYEAAAHHQVDTDSLSSDQVAAEIALLYRR
ncbi:MAG: shikimate kinase [Deltaproteobacteria bacterium]|nr:shikimate kinase [Deltaproteobacteria bacterium]MBI3388058.1 shikimate kinase [Deltaproteobacteria bacterium]